MEMSDEEKEVSKSNDGKSKRFFWKGKRVTERVFKDRTRRQKFGKTIRTIYGTKSAMHNLKSDENIDFKIEGRRIIHPFTLASQLICKKCDSVLSLLDTVEEVRHGLASTFYVKCRQCNIINDVASDKRHKMQVEKSAFNDANTMANTDKRCKMSNEKSCREHFDTNTMAVAGILDGGMGNSHINKFLSSLNIPELNWNVYYTHEREVGKMIEKMAEDSCKRAALEERQLTIQNIDKLKPLLPPHLQNDFVLPEKSDNNGNYSVLKDHKVRIAASFDTAWVTRGTGRSYDSLTGYAALIGYFSKKIISFISLNRKCKKCDLGHEVKDHDCRRNFIGSAKAMEPAAAVKLTVNNDILSDCNIQVGFLIADNDSSSISAVRNNINYEIVKQDDKNHTGKGVTNELYRMKKNFKELNSTSISYLNKCFNYAVSQNIGNVVGMSTAIRNIPHHCFNNHQNCGSWCGFMKDPQNYTHKIIGEGFTDEKLFEALQCLFNTLGSNANRFVAGVSSNVNESFHSIIASKAPKSRLYGMSPSGDIRSRCAVNKKNDGEHYMVNLRKELLLSPGRNTLKYSNKVDSHTKKRYNKALTKEFKCRRLLLKKQKTELRNKNENSEGTTYETDVQLLQTSHTLERITDIDESAEPIIVYFDIETTDFAESADIIQIGAKCESCVFSIYIRPSKVISEGASAVTGLRYSNGKLFFHEEEVITFSLVEAMQAFYQFLSTFGRKCIITAHHCSFDRPRFLNAIKKVCMVQHFKSVIHGFTDTLPIARKSTGKKGKGSNQLSTLAQELSISCDGAHNAVCDVEMLEQVMIKLNISKVQIIQASLSWDKSINKKEENAKVRNLMSSLRALEKCTSIAMRKKMIINDISYDMILNAYKENKFMGLKNLLGEDENGSIKVTKNRKVVQKICDYLNTSL